MAQRKSAVAIDKSGEENAPVAASEESTGEVTVRPAGLKKRLAVTRPGESGAVEAGEQRPTLLGKKARKVAVAAAAEGVAVAAALPPAPEVPAPAVEAAAGPAVARGPCLRVTLFKSQIGYKYDQKRTLSALGLHRLNMTVELPDNASVRGMLFKVRHLVRVEEIAGT